MIPLMLILLPACNDSTDSGACSTGADSTGTDSTGANPFGDDSTDADPNDDASTGADPTGVDSSVRVHSPKFSTS